MLLYSLFYFTLIDVRLFRLIRDELGIVHRFHFAEPNYY